MVCLQSKNAFTTVDVCKKVENRDEKDDFDGTFF